VFFYLNLQIKSKVHICWYLAFAVT